MRAIIFDLDGTLLNSMAADCRIFERSIAAVLGPVKIRDDYNDYLNVTDQGIVEELMAENGLGLDAGVVAAVRRKFIDGLSRHIAQSGPFSEVLGVSGYIDRLRNDRDTRIAIATGCWRDSALLKLDSSGIDVSDVPLATCDDSPVRTEIMLSAFEKIDHPVDSVTYFGDAHWDRRACQVLGWDFVAVGPDLDGLNSYEGL